VDPLPFIAAAYALTIGGVLLMLGASWRRMRRAEQQEDRG
jgi:hypothetical protein